ncbi:MAG: hypothetical protein ACLQBX_07895 [Candidatus Limnocylindrales bacterium]
MSTRDVGRRLLVGLTVLMVLLGCGASASPTPGAAALPRSVPVPPSITAPTGALVSATLARSVSGPPTLLAP